MASQCLHVSHTRPRITVKRNDHGQAVKVTYENSLLVCVWYLFICLFACLLIHLFWGEESRSLRPRLPKHVWMLWLMPPEDSATHSRGNAKHHTLHRVTPTAKNSLPQTAHITENKNPELVRPWGLAQTSVGSPLPASIATVNTHSSHRFAGLCCHIQVCPGHSCHPQMGVETLS